MNAAPTAGDRMFFYLTEEERAFLARMDARRKAAGKAIASWGVTKFLSKRKNQAVLAVTMLGLAAGTAEMRNTELTNEPELQPPSAEFTPAYDPANSISALTAETSAVSAPVSSDRTLRIGRDYGFQGMREGATRTTYGLTYRRLEGDRMEVILPGNIRRQDRETAE